MASKRGVVDEPGAPDEPGKPDEAGEPGAPVASTGSAATATASIWPLTVFMVSLRTQRM